MLAALHDINGYMRGRAVNSLLKEGQISVAEEASLSREMVLRSDKFTEFCR